MGPYHFYSDFGLVIYQSKKINDIQDQSGWIKMNLDYLDLI